MPAIFSFYLYSRRENVLLDFASDNAEFMAALRGLINGLPKVEGANIQALLRNDAALRERLVAFEAAYEGVCPKVKRIMAYVQRLGVGELFFYVDGNAPLINRLCCVAAVKVFPDMAKRQQVCDAVLLQYGKLFTKFRSYGFGFDGVRVSVGDNYHYPCRFCEKDRTMTSFRKEAHAIPDALGNHLLFCNEECGKCNQDLAPVEDNLTHYLDVNRVMAGIRSKKGELPEVEGDNFVIRRMGDSVGIYARSEAPAEEVAVKGLRLNHRTGITNLGIYKALVKAAIDLLPSEVIPHFRETIRWIKGGVVCQQMSSIYWRYVQPVQQPILFIFISEGGKPCIPYCTCVLYVTNVAFMYVVPFVDVDAGQYKRDEALVGHWPLFQNTFGGEWMAWNLSDDTPASPFIDVLLSKDHIAGHEAPFAVLPDDVFNIHRRPVKREYVEFPELDPTSLFRAKPVCQRLQYVAENQEQCHPQPHTELSYNMTCDILVNYDNGTCTTLSMIEVCDSPNQVRFLSMKWECTFYFKDIISNIEVSEHSFCFDYKLRDLLWQFSLYLGECEFQGDIDTTALRGIKLSSVYDEHHMHFVRYFLEKDGAIAFVAKDEDIHRL